MKRLLSGRFKERISAFRVLQAEDILSAFYET